MKHKTWFRLVLKAVGVLLLGFALPELARPLVWLSQLLQSYKMAQAGAAPAFWGLNGAGYAWVSDAAPPMLQALIGLYLLRGGTWLVNLCIPSNRPYCPDCGYDVSKTASGAPCPECGAALPRSVTSGGGSS